MYFLLPMYNMPGMQWEMAAFSAKMIKLILGIAIWVKVEYFNKKQSVGIRCHRFHIGIQ